MQIKPKFPRFCGSVRYRNAGRLRGKWDAGRGQGLRQRQDLHTADKEPHRRNNGNYKRNHQTADQVIIAPPVFRPDIKNVPGHDHQKQAKSKTEGIKEHTPCNDFIT